MELFDFDRITISEWALREGIVLDAVGRHDPADWSDDPRAIRRESVLSLCRRCNWAEAHARSGAGVDMHALSTTRAAVGARKDQHAPAARTAPRHDIGEHVSSSGHTATRRISCATGSYAGFNPEEIEMLGCAMAPRRRPASTTSAPLDARRSNAPAPRAATIADGLDRSQPGVYGVDDDDPVARLLRLRAVDDVELEVGARRKRLLEKVLGREVELSLHPSLK
jgi:exopolyphosphatase/guanosine-5'-triphosphate,3'-diphosphate pyrophosphatase